MAIADPRAARQGRWQDDADIAPAGYQDLMVTETLASEILIHDAQQVPDLLRTRTTRGRSRRQPEPAGARHAGPARRDEPDQAYALSSRQKSPVTSGCSPTCRCPPCLRMSRRGC